MRCRPHRGQRQSKGYEVRHGADAANGNLDFQPRSTGDGDRLADRRRRMLPNGTEAVNVQTVPAFGRKPRGPRHDEILQQTDPDPGRSDRCRTVAARARLCPGATCASTAPPAVAAPRYSARSKSARSKSTDLPAPAEAVPAPDRAARVSRTERRSGPAHRHPAHASARPVAVGHVPGRRYCGQSGDGRPCLRIRC